MALINMCIACSLTGLLKSSASACRSLVHCGYFAVFIASFTGFWQTRPLTTLQAMPAPVSRRHRLSKSMFFLLEWYFSSTLLYYCTLQCWHIMEFLRDLNAATNRPILRYIVGYRCASRGVLFATLSSAQMRLPRDHNDFFYVENLKHSDVFCSSEHSTAMDTFLKNVVR